MLLPNRRMLRLPFCVWGCLVLFVIEHLHQSAIGGGIGGARRKLIINMVGFDYCTADAVYLCVCGCKALCLLSQFPIGWDNDEQVDTVEGMKILMRHISNGLWC